MAKKELKPTVDVVVECSHCGKLIEVKVFKTRLNPVNPMPPEWDIRAEVKKAESLH